MRITVYKMKLGEGKHPVLEKERSCNYSTETDTFSTPEKIAAMLDDIFALPYMAEEYLYMLALDTKCHLLGIFEVSHGTVCHSPCEPREMLIRALLCGASGIIIAHNHPSGITEPSNEDISACSRLKKACDIIGVTLYDSIIVARNGNNAVYRSLRRDGDGGIWE